MSLDPPPTTEARTNPTRKILGRTLWLIAVLGLMGLSFLMGRVTIGSSSLPEIAATLPGDESGFARELNQRMRERFPVGSGEDQLLYYLRTEHFTPDWRQRDEPNGAYFLHRGLICEQMVRVIWSADRSGVLTSIAGDFNSHCI